MPTIQVGPQRPEYTSVKEYLSDLAMDVAELVDNHAEKKRFREQLRTYKKMWKAWTTAEAIRKECGKAQMGGPEHPLNFFRFAYNLYPYFHKTEARRLAGCYSLLAFIHDRQFPDPNEKINNNIIVSAEIIEQTLAAPGNQIGGGHINRKSREIREMHLIERNYNLVKVDIQKCVASRTVESEAKKVRKAKELDRVAKLSDVELFEYVANMFKKRELKVLKKDEIWPSLDRSLKPWFEIAVERLEQVGKENEIGLLQYHYGNLLHYAHNINITSFRGFPDAELIKSASKCAGELTKKFEEIAQSCAEDITARKPTEREQENGGQASGAKVGDIKPKQRITLKDFIKKHCDLSERPDIDSKCEMLMREHRKNRIKLPLVKAKYRRGQRYLYWLDKLHNNWPSYRMTLTTLPPLKESTNK